ncbi:hypothetical protein ACIQI7_21815 [Kitasatospora sp. NPDC092039]|uniref:hypothetical protein n=1 Tax=Kitasatospora sp. NPDC092039 TaxID=3364086 RepID=UPI0037FA48AA
MINEGAFVPRLRDEAPTEDAAQDAEPEVQAEQPPSRHILACASTLRIAPGPIDELCCVALDEDTADRCKRGVFEPDEGQWVQMPVPAPRTRTRARTAPAGGPMWVWEVNPLLGYMDSLRWLRQHCAGHHQSEAPDATAVELVDFHPGWHAPYVLRDRPEGFALPAEPAEKPQGREHSRVVCAGDDCHNSTVVRGVRPGWLCYVCTRRAGRRTATHRRWQQYPRTEGQ